MAINEDGAVVTDSEDEEYDSEGDYVTDEDGEEYVEEEDGEIEELDEDEEELEDEDAEEIRGIPLRGGAGGAQGAQEWKGIDELPAPTQKAFQDVISDLRCKGKREVTVLLLGRHGVGKSSTGNALLNEAVFQAGPFQQDVIRPVTAVRSSAGFRLRVVDTPGLMNGDIPSPQALQLIQAEAAAMPIDVVLYIDRLDFYRVEPADSAAMEAVSRVLGADIWQHAILGLTRSQLTPPPANTTYDDFLKRRVDGLQQALRAAGAGGPLPYALIENSSKCNTNAEGEKVLPDGTVWQAALLQKVAARATEGRRAFRADAEAAAKKANPNRRGKWWIPVVLLAQIAFKVFVLDRLIEDDGIRGDEYGEFDSEIVAEERGRLKRSKEAKAKQRKTEREAEAAARAEAALSTGSAVSDGGEEAEEEEEEDEEESSEEDSD